MKEFVLVSALCASVSCEGGGSFRPLQKGDIYQPLQDGEGSLPLQDGDGYRLLRNSDSGLPLQAGNTYRFQRGSLTNRPLQDVTSTHPLQDVKSAPPLQDIKSAPPLQDAKSVPPLLESWLPLPKSRNGQPLPLPDGDTFRPRRDLQAGDNHHPLQDSGNHRHQDVTVEDHLIPKIRKLYNIVNTRRDVYRKLRLERGDSERPKRDSQFFQGQAALQRPGDTGFRSGGRLISVDLGNSAPALTSGGLGHSLLGPRLQPAVAPPFTVALGLAGGQINHHGHLDSFTAPAVPAQLRHTDIFSGHRLGHTVAAAPHAHSAALISPAVAPAFSSYAAGLPVVHAGPAVHVGPAVHAAVAAPVVHSTDDSLDEIIPYSYVYAVHDRLSGSNYDVSESDDGTGVRTGSYSVSLPDGRTQHVVYTADSGGYVATVTYEGTAVYPDL